MAPHGTGSPAYGGMRWRELGPHRGGRVVAVAGHPERIGTFYMGASGGGVWRTDNAGHTWRNLTDGQVGSASVGALAVSDADPSVLYVGMGESCIRGNVGFGDGVYRSRDGGATWRRVGLADTEHIARIRVHPSDPDTLYVAAFGHAFGPHEARGVYRSTDGGGRFDRVLYRDPDTGAIDLSMDPLHPAVLYAAMWQARRLPWNFSSGGPGSGLFRSRDGGDTWEELSGRGGFPAGPLGRIGVAASGARSGRVWAIVEAADGGLFRSDDFGDTWTRVSADAPPRARPWYYSHVFADPSDAETVYALAMQMLRSTDGGRTFRQVATPHPDHHDLWIDPRRPERMIHGADGGAAISLDGGRSWSGLYSQPTAELYHVAVDTRFPYRVYGSQQDNTTLSLPSRSDSAGIGMREWYDVGGAESAHIAVRPDDPDVVFATSSGGGEGGRITRYDHRTRQMRDVSVWPELTGGMAAAEYTHRFQWLSPLALSPHDPNVLYSCGNRVFRSDDQGESWRPISPDLTRADPTKLGPSGGLTREHTGVEVFCTVFAFAESTLQRDLLWAGTDDGRLHVSEDGGGNWREVTPPQLPEWSTVSGVEPSRHDPDRAYVAAHRYRLDDRRPLVYRTDDRGHTWTAITAGIPEDEYVRCVREDPERPGLVYLGTERSVYVSFDAGARWLPLGLNLPLVAVHDLAVAGSDLVAATHGRGFWVLDDLTPLRQLDAAPAAGGVRLFAPRPTVRMRLGGMLLLGRESTEQEGLSVLELWEGTSYTLARRPEPGEAPRFEDAGQNPPAGVLIHYALERDAAEVTVTVRDAAGREAGRLTSADDRPGRVRPPAAAGAHRVVWDLTWPGARTPTLGRNPWPDRPVCAPLATPGDYQVELGVAFPDRPGEPISLSAPFRVLADPRCGAAPADLEARFALECAIRDCLSQVNGALDDLRRLRAAVEAAVARLPDGEGAEVRAQAAALQEDLNAAESCLTQVAFREESPKGHAGGLDAQLAHLFEVVASADAAPTRQARERHAQLEDQCRAALRQVTEVIDRAGAVEAALSAAGVGLLVGPGRGATASP
jgi:photosystem II stability/assembly factor-like uncharacterized protein